jgi:hypothetical protein
VDDSIIAGRKPVIDRYYNAFKKHLKIERLGKMKKHLGIWWEWKQEERGLYLEGSMEKIGLEIIKAFEDHTGRKTREVDTPAYPGKYWKGASKQTKILRKQCFGQFWANFNISK